MNNLAFDFKIQNLAFANADNLKLWLYITFCYLRPKLLQVFGNNWRNKEYKKVPATIQGTEVKKQKGSKEGLF